MNLRRIAIPMVLALVSSACTTASKQAPVLVQASDVGPSPLSFLVPPRNLSTLNGTVVRYLSEGKPYYYVRSPCCDLHNHLYDSDGNYLCAPEGGFTGRGDGKCPSGLHLKHSEGVVVFNPFYKP